MLIVLFGLVCGGAGFAVGWTIGRRETLLRLHEKGNLERKVFETEFEKDF